MIVGFGLIGSSLMSVDYSGVTVFASGVSNSQETNQGSFSRERELLKRHLSQPRESHLIYISTCSVHDSLQNASPYIEHKKEMEKLVLSEPRTSIVRLPNVVGPNGNKRNLVNYLVGAITSGERVFVQELAKRYLLGVDEMRALIHAYISQGPEEGAIVEFAPPFSTPVLELVAQIEQILDLEANVEIAGGGSSYPIDFGSTAHFSKAIGLEFPENYTNLILKKWILNPL
jgi:UDP-2-acetamido-2,6-beta-L-arabino-hexul-4-ose reductase